MKEQIVYKNLSEGERIFEALALPWESGFSAVLSSQSGAAALSRCVQLEKTSLQELLKTLSSAACAFEIRYQSGLTGSVLLLCRTSDLSRLSGQLTGTSTKEEGALSPEVIESCVRFLTQVVSESNALFSARHGAVASSDPELINPDGDTVSLEPLGSSYEGVLCATYRVGVDPALDCPFHLLIDVPLQESLTHLVKDYKPGSRAPEPATQKPPSFGPARSATAARPSPAGNSRSAKSGHPEKLPANLNIDLLLDVELPIAVSFGECEMPLKDVLKLAAGSVIELDKSVNDPVTVIVNQKPVARGEVVMVDGNYGVRITEVESTADRIRSFA